MDILLIAGLWLDGSAWGEVVPAARALGHRPVPLTLPGQGDGAATPRSTTRWPRCSPPWTPRPARPMVVGHSAACTLAWLAADARPSEVAKVALIGGFPADRRPAVRRLLPERPTASCRFPGWGPFEGADSADLDEATRQPDGRGGDPGPRRSCPRAWYG